MRSIVGSTGGALAVAILLAAPASAQRADSMGPASVHSGFAATFGLGAANTGLSCPSCGDLDRVTGPAASLTLAWAVTPRLRVGADFTGWSEDMGWAKKTLQSYSLVAQLYPSTTNGAWLRLGAGHAKLSVQESGAFEQSGPAFTLATGWDLRLRDRYAVAPFAQYLHQLPSDASGSGAHEGKGRATMFQLGVGVTYGR